MTVLCTPQEFCSPQTRKTHETSVHWIDPLTDLRWEPFLAAHSRASVFHSRAWLMALNHTYGYQAVACTISGPDEQLRNAIVFCKVDSWLTGRRLVSVPFSDHCEPLVESSEDLKLLARAFEEELELAPLDYVEVRPLHHFEPKTTLHRTSIPYSFHVLDLTTDLQSVFRSFHKNCIQRKVRRAEHEHLAYSEGRSSAHLDEFYRLFTLTRERLKVPPQPKAWFCNLIACLGSAVKIRLACDGAVPVAAIMTITHKDTLYYKYGCSNADFNKLGPIQMLLWRAIQDAHASGLRFVDFGRTDADQTSLIQFKDRWGATRSTLQYYRYSKAARATHAFDLSGTKWKFKTAKFLLSYMPSPIVSKIGQALYSHVG